MPDDRIAAVRALEVLDSRGNPTVEVEVRLEDGASGRAIVPSGASTGTPRGARAARRRPEALRRQGRPATRSPTSTARSRTRVIGQLRRATSRASTGCSDRPRRHAEQVASRRQRAARRLAGGGARRGGVARASRCTRTLGGDDANLLPLPLFNVLNGGKHATRSTDFQEFMLAPVGLPTFSEALRAGVRGLPGAEEAARRARPQHQRRRRGRLRAVAGQQRRGRRAAGRGDRGRRLPARRGRRPRPRPGDAASSTRTAATTSPARTAA